jgi:uncharacterized protein YbbK (DUF523 family)
MELVLVSACLLGEAVRYNGADKRCRHNILERWISQGRVVSVCPEIAGGLSVPRLPSEIVKGAGGLKVLSGNAKVFNSAAIDVTTEFIKGAEYALEIATSMNIKIAVLKEGSPSCGSSFIYDGSFTSQKVFSSGVTTAMLQKAGLKVFNETQLEEADLLLR